MLYHIIPHYITYIIRGP